MGTDDSGVDHGVHAMGWRSNWNGWTRMQSAELATSGRSRPRASRAGEGLGEVIIDLAIVSVAFFSILFAAVDVGRAIYVYSALNSAVHEGARYGALNPAETTNIKNRVIEKAPQLSGLGYSDIEISCGEVCNSESSEVTVSASYTFEAVTASFLGFGPFNLSTSAETESQ
jgi:hypothetical protein